MNEEVWLSAKELAEQVGVCESTIRRLKRLGQIRYVQPGGPGSRVLFPPNAFDVTEQPSQEQRGPRPQSAEPTESSKPRVGGHGPATSRRRSGGRPR